MTVPLYHIDAFTDRPFAGNPAAVCLLLQKGDPEWMQQVAAEMNLSETAFVWPHPRNGGFELRWFTPAAEVELCGHATLATAHLLWERDLTQAAELIVFHTKHRGKLTCTREATGLIGMDFPLDPPREENAEPPPGLLEALGGGEPVAPVNIARSTDDWIVELADEQAVRAAQPDFAALRQFETRGVAITARSDEPGLDIVSRFFAPRLRIDEDPVTGSVHCALGPYWHDRLGQPPEIWASQLSPRGGKMRLRMLADHPGRGGRAGRIELAGQAVTVAAGQLEV